MKNIILFLILCIFSSGCTTMEVLKFQDHPKKPVTTLQTFKTTSFVFSSTENQFWLCKEEGNNLNCARECGSGMDLECPPTRQLSIGSGTTVVQ